MKIAYADPPYIGQAKKHYNSNEINHKELIEQLIRDYPDGWALSCSSCSLKEILSYCPDGIRIMAWVKPFCSFKPNVNPAYAWEPVIVFGGRKINGKGQNTVRDWVSANITLKRGVHGVKPKEFCFWLFNVLGLTADDEFVDLFFGSGAVSSAWNEFKNKVGGKGK
jgi:hypothetical protein